MTKEINIKIILWDSKPKKENYDLFVDGQYTLNVKKGNLRLIVYEIEKYLRLRFREDLRNRKEAQQ